ncbi:prophage pi2 protein 11, topoisomerase [Fructobacillus fructosus]|uniref:Sak single strand annealing protein n=1 Tax=Fructobacillus fructosus TaxID=1631 RepID=UPI0002195A42|nr:DUF1071 domain-containing protein [Fructobacillus fructosus]KRN52160.1 hypothetical protein IV71_GL001423 [Fructobacillus fructosus KCTC 3544]GAP02097.1 prophage pi2 protein 11, topoisomerase [Fructobacillus fructosus]
MTETKSVFKTLSEINVNEHVDKKGNFKYLSWPWAISEVMKRYPDTTYEMKENEDGEYLFGNPQKGYMVKTTVTIQGRTLGMQLPVMDVRNKSLLKPTSTDENKAIMRCLVKNLSMFGLGIYIYAGEDLPDVDPKKITPEQANILDITIQNAEKVTGKHLLSWATSQLGVAKLSDINENDYKQAEKFVNDLLEKAKDKAEIKKEEQTA